METNESDYRTNLPNVLLIAEDDLRRRFMVMSPHLQAQTEVMAQLIRELVNLEREKRGLDRPSGKIELYPNKEKKHPTEPDLTCAGFVCGRSYRAAGWLSKPDKVKITLLPQKPK
jgi:hypothetical protein